MEATTSSQDHPLKTLMRPSENINAEDLMVVMEDSPIDNAKACEWNRT